MTFGGNFTTSTGGGGGGDTGDPLRFARFDTPTASSVNGLLTSTATTLAIVTYNLTVPGLHKRNVVVTLGSRVGGYVGPWTLTGTILGVEATENLTIPANGNAEIVGKRCWDPGALTLARPAQLATDGSVQVGLGDSIGLPAQAEESASPNFHGHLLSVIDNGSVSVPADGVFGSIVGPSIAGGHGAYSVASGHSIIGQTIEITYLGTVE